MKRAALFITTFYILGLALAAAKFAWEHVGEPTVPIRHGLRLAPDPDLTPEAIFQLYSAKSQGAKGIFGEHTWLVMKKARALNYERYEVYGWSRQQGKSVVRQNYRSPDRHWLGSQPQTILDVRGCRAERLIEMAEKAVHTYPHAQRYVLWPGPNSNTFTQHIVHALPPKLVKLPNTAIGKDFAPGATLRVTPSGTGLQLNLLGVLGITVAGFEGLEINILGLVAGLDVESPALLLPGIGRIGVSAQREIQTSIDCP